jgi:hypothetical protein
MSEPGPIDCSRIAKLCLDSLPGTAYGDSS